MKRLALVALLIFGTSFSQAAPSRNKSVDDDRTSYRTSSNQYNLRFSPIALVIGALQANFDVVVDPNWTVGPQFDYMNITVGSTSDFATGYKISGMGLAGRANWFKNGVYTDGLYVGPSIGYQTIKFETTDSLGTTSAEASGAILRCLVGYGWFWDSFNQMLGIGAGASLGNTSIKVTERNGTVKTVSGPGSGLALEYSLGWTF